MTYTSINGMIHWLMLKTFASEVQTRQPTFQHQWVDTDAIHRLLFFSRCSGGSTRSLASRTSFSSRGIMLLTSVQQTSEQMPKIRPSLCCYPPSQDLMSFLHTTSPIPWSYQPLATTILSFTITLFQIHERTSSTTTCLDYGSSCFLAIESTCLTKIGTLSKRRSWLEAITELIWQINYLCFHSILSTMIANVAMLSK